MMKIDGVEARLEYERALARFAGIAELPPGTWIAFDGRSIKELRAPFREAGAAAAGV